MMYYPKEVTRNRSKKIVLAIVLVIIIVTTSMVVIFLLFLNVPSMTFREYLSAFDENGDESLEDESNYIAEEYRHGRTIVISDRINQSQYVEGNYGGYTFVLFESVFNTGFETVPFAIEGNQTKEYRPRSTVNYKTTVGTCDWDQLPGGRAEMISEVTDGMSFLVENGITLNWETVTKHNVYLGVRLESESDTNWTFLVVLNSVPGNETSAKLLKNDQTVNSYSSWTYQKNWPAQGNIVWMDLDIDGRLDPGDRIVIAKPEGASGEYTFEVWYIGYWSIRKQLNA